MASRIGPEWRSLLEVVERIAPSNASVLIQGEPGSDKEALARAVHGLSPRRDAPFLAINCAGV